MPGPETDLITLAQMLGEQFAVPQILVVAQVARRAPQILEDVRPGGSSQPARAAGAVLFPQPAEAAGRKAMNPPLDRGRMLAQPRPHRRAVVALANQQHRVQPMVIPGFRGAADLLLHRRSPGGRVGDLQSFHAPAVREFRGDGKHIILHYL